MNCVEFDRTWQERLDHPGGKVDDDLARHAAGCPACAQLHAGYLALNAALACRPQTAETALIPGFTDRILADAAVRRRPVPLPLSTRRIGRGLVPLAMAAGVLLTIGLTWNAWRRDGGEPPSIEQPAEPRPLSVAVAEYTSASLALARQTSAPAARLGLDALAGPDASDPAAVDDSWRQIGNRLDEEIAPLRGSTRRAFSFLLAPEPTGIDAG